MALTERADEARQMQTVVKLLAQTVELPLVLDSTEVEVIRAALEVCPGRPVVNSINLENGRDRAEAVLQLCRDFGAAVIALTIDEAGMAQDRAAETGNRPAPLRPGGPGTRPAAGGPDLRSPHLYPGHGRG